MACKEAWELGGEASMPGTILRDMHRALATHRDGCWFRQCVDGQCVCFARLVQKPPFLSDSPRFRLQTCCIQERKA